MLCMCMHCIAAYSQDLNPEEPEQDSLTEEQSAIVLKRTWANNFSQSIHKIGDPSIASFVITDFHHNTNSSYQKKNFILNTTIQPIVGIGGKRWYIGNFVHTFQIVPTISIRIFQNDSNFKDHSMPVRTPSFMAKFNYFFSHSKLWNDHSKYKIYFGFTATHHSNGQDGYEFIEDRIKNDSIINTYSGNFSEIGFFEWMTGGMKVSERTLNAEERKDKNSPLRRLQFDSKSSITYWKLGYEFHPSSLSSEKFQRYNLYGRKRLNAQLGYLFNQRSRHVAYSRQKQKWVPLEKAFHNREIRRVVINFSYILDGRYNISEYVKEEKIAPFFDVAKRMNIDFTWYERVGTTSDCAIFMRVGYYGSDPYNIYFQESIWVARVGIAFGNFAYGEKK